MRTRHRLAIAGILGAISCCQMARAQCGVNCECDSVVEYDSYSNQVWAGAYTLNYYYVQYVSVSAILYTPSDPLYKDDFYEGDWAEDTSVTSSKNGGTKTRSY